MTRLLALVLLLLAPLARAETDVTVVTSPGGITAWLVQEDSIPLVALDIHFAGGAVLDPPEKAGATRMMTALLEEGAGDYDSVGFAEARQDLGARFGFSASKESVSLSAVMLSENRDQVVDLMALALHAPTFPEDAMARVRPQLLSVIRSAMRNPQSIARTRFLDKALPGAAYARSVDGTVETVTALTREDMIAAHRRAFARDDMTIGAVGDITPEALGALLDRLLGPLPTTAPERPEPTPPEDTAETIVIDFQSPQSVAVFGHMGIAREDPDFLAAFVANHALGGSFGSRLTQELRENRGLTYGIGTSLSTGPQADFVIGSVSSANATMAEAVTAVQDEWQRIAENGLTEDELVAIKRYLTGSYPLRFDGNRQVAGLLVSTQLAGLSPDYIRNRNALIEALSLEEVNRVAAELFRPDALRFVVVGQPQGLPVTD